MGDFGLNYDLGVRDFYAKRSLTKLPITFLGVHGNHEERPCNVKGYTLVDSPFGVGKMWHDPQFPNQYFFENGVHTIYGKTILVLGGAYSVDKYYRLINGHKWFPSEQLTMDEKWNLQQTTYNGKYDYVFSHTCPTNYTPTDMFLPMIKQEEVDKSTEDFLQTIHDQITYDKWYCGHWHTDRIVDKIRFVFHDYLEVGNDY